MYRRVLTAAVLSVLIASSGSLAQNAPAQAPEPCVRIDIPYTQFQLPNGLSVVLHEDHTVPMVAVDVWYRVGSAREKPGRTGLAHLFEHILFEGSKHVKTGEFDSLLEAAGGSNNGSTANDRTDYYEVVPSSALELALFLESDRMGYLLDVLSPARVDQQRDVVKNERRESYENQPYGVVGLELPGLLFPAGHPYHWPVIGSMEDLTAASHEDIADFFREYYGPRNSTLVLAGDFATADAKRLVEKWFSDVGAGKRPPPMHAPPAELAAEKRVVLEDRVQLPRLYMVWITPALFQPGDEALDILSSVLASGKNSRLYKRLVYDLQIAQDVSAIQASQALVSTFQIIATARQGHTLSEIERVIQEELDRIKAEPPSRRELDRALNEYEADFYRGLERNLGKAELLNSYEAAVGRPDYANEDLSRHRALGAEDLMSAARHELSDDARLVLSVVPAGKKDLAAAAASKGAAR